jgi:hypothetical protein
MTDAQRQQVAKCLRYIDEARRALERQENPDNREIIRELRDSARKIFDVLTDLESDDSLLGPKGDHGIDASSASGGKPHANERHSAQEQGNSHEHHRVSGSDAEQKTLDDPRQAKR